MKSYNAIDIAQFIVEYYENEDYEINNLGLQNVLFFIQWYFLKNYNRPCFSDKIESWKYCPVVPNVFDIFKIYEDIAIPNIPRLIGYKGSSNNINYQDKQIIKTIISKIINYPMEKLVQMTNKKGGSWDQVEDYAQISIKLIKDDTTMKFE